MMLAPSGAGSRSDPNGATPRSDFTRLVIESMPFEAAWNLVSAAPAAAADLTDRGCLRPGLRADLLIVDPGQRRILTTLSNGRLAYQSA